MTTIFGACPDHSGSGVFGNINKRVAGEHEDPDQSDLRSFCFFFFFRQQASTLGTLLDCLENLCMQPFCSWGPDSSSPHLSWLEP